MTGPQPASASGAGDGTAPAPDAGGTGPPPGSPAGSMPHADGDTGRTEELRGRRSWFRRRSGAGSAAGGPAARESETDATLVRRTRVRLVAWSAAITLAIVVGLGLVAYEAVGASLATTATDRLRERADQIVRTIQRLPNVPDRIGSGDRLAFPVGLAFGGRYGGSFAVIIGPDGQSIGPPDLTLAGLPLQAGADAARAGQVDTRQASVDGNDVWVVSEALSLGGRTFIVQVVGDRESDARTLGIMLAIFGVAGLAALVLSVGGGWLYARRALAPIRTSLRRQREFAADASHELRTPLAVIRGTVEHLERHPERTMGQAAEELADVRAEVDHLTGLVESLLMLARADSGAIEVERIPTDLAVAATAAADLLRPLATGRGVNLIVDAAPAPLMGDPMRLRQLAMILGDNAVRLTPAGGTVTVRTRPDGSGAVLIVEDEGPGIRPEDAPHLFERFWRAADAPPGGSGLGLAIAAWVADRHAGRLSAANRPGGGARFEARLAGAA